MTRFAWVCLAGALGAGVRYLVGQWTLARFGAGFPWGTLAVNLVGCFLIAGIMQLAVRSTAISPDLRVALTSGFVGGLTTYSSFNWEATRLFQGGARGTAVLYVVVTFVGCLAAGWLGFVAARRI